MPVQKRIFTAEAGLVAKIRFWTGMISHRSEIVVGCAGITEDPWQERGLFIQNL